MARQPWEKWATGDWLREPGIRAMTAEARGVWIEILHAMVETDTYEISGTYREIAKQCNALDADEVERGIRELEKWGVAEIVRGHFGDSPGNVPAHVTVLSRRREKEHKRREYEREKKKRQRESEKKEACPDNVPAMSPYLISESESKGRDKRGSGGKKRPREEDVERVYQAYPRKVGKRAALKAIEKALARVDRDNPVGYLLDRVSQYAESPAGNAGKFTPHPATWFNRDGFDDDPAEWLREDSGSRSASKRPAEMDNITWLKRQGFSHDEARKLIGEGADDQARIGVRADGQHE